MPFWLRRAELGWDRSGSKHLMHHATRDRMPVAVRGCRAAGERASAQRSGWYPLLPGFVSQGGLLYLRQEAQRPPSDRPCMRFDKDAISDGLERPNLITSLEESRTTLEE